MTPSARMACPVGTARVLTPRDESARVSFSLVATQMLGASPIDAYATNKAILFQMSDQSSGSRVLDGRWGVELFALAIPKGRGAALESVQVFVDAAKSEGLVERAAARAGMRGIVNAQ